MRFALALALAMALAACGGSGSSSPPPANPAATEVDLTSAGLSPSTVTIVSGGLVRFVNKDSAAHQIASSACAELDSPSMSSGQDFSVAVTGMKQCSFIDGLNPAAASFHGILNVAPAGSDAGPGY